ncbi:MAG: hypothetical protein H0X50_02210 [Nitrosopumilus sp.]|nr:hypothetical protein [Nitrosopumilus sp.]
MIIRLEQTFIDTVSQLNSNFSGGERHILAANIESKYNDILSVIKHQEDKKADLEPKIIELGNIGPRLFSLSLYYNGDSMNDDIPLSVTQLLPTISPVRIDIMTRLQNQHPNGNDSSYLKAGQVYDDGDTHSRYIDEIIEEDEGMRPPS